MKDDVGSQKNTHSCFKYFYCPHMPSRAPERSHPADAGIRRTSSKCAAAAHLRHFKGNYTE